MTFQNLSAVLPRLPCASRLSVPSPAYASARNRVLVLRNGTKRIYVLSETTHPLGPEQTVSESCTLSTSTVPDSGYAYYTFDNQDGLWQKLVEKMSP